MGPNLSGGDHFLDFSRGKEKKFGPLQVITQERKRGAHDGNSNEKGRGTASRHRP